MAQPVSDRIGHRWQRDPVLCAQGRGRVGARAGLDADDPDFRVHCLGGNGGAGGQPAAADRHEDHCQAGRLFQFASEALDAHPRELANISQVLGHDSIETTLHFYIHASANAGQRIGAMMNARWTSMPALASNRA
jgi:hypothetical protein